jgi:murein L,D-transpeptidase YcbB/YkuD
VPPQLQNQNTSFITNDISRDSKSAVYDAELKEGILKFKKVSTISNKDITRTHQIHECSRCCIKNIMINMERCRWISNDITKSKELIVVNIPAYELTFFEMETRISIQGCGGESHEQNRNFSANKYIVFRPNVPTVFLSKKKFFPPLKRIHLAEHNMEWKDSFVRQRPGPENSLGLVKFLFPNSNAIYLHDTPSKVYLAGRIALLATVVFVAKPKRLP